MAYEGLTNSELIEFLDLPADTVDKLRTAEGTTWQAVKNQFLDALYNKVLYQTVASLDFENPFKKFDSFPVNFGDTIENIFVEMPTGQKFDANVTNPFAKATPSVKSLYATINYELKYKTTVEDSLLRRATLNQYGFMNLIDTIVMQLAKSASIDEYFATMPWIAVPFDSDNKELLGDQYGIQGIPTLLIFDKKGKLIDQSARATVMQQKEKALDSWKAKASA